MSVVAASGGAAATSATHMTVWNADGTLNIIMAIGWGAYGILIVGMMIAAVMVWIVHERRDAAERRRVKAILDNPPRRARPNRGA